MAALSLLVAPSAWAQSDQDLASARAAATAGAQAFEAGNWKRAVDFFERAEALFHSPVHLWYLASASAKLGRLVAAQEKCTKVRREGIPAGASEGVVAAYEGCAELLEDLDGRIPALTLEVAGVPDGLIVELSRNGVPVPSATLGVPVPLDPGAYSFEGIANGFRGRASVTLKEGQRQLLVLKFQPDASAVLTSAPPSEPEPADSKALQASAASSAEPVPAPSSGGKGPPLGSYLSWVIGAGGIGMGVPLTLMALDTGKTIDALCNGNRQPCEVDPRDDATKIRITGLKGDEQLFYIMSGVGYGVGGVGIVTGFLIWALKPQASSQAKAQGIELTPVLGFQHVGIAGRF